MKGAQSKVVTNKILSLHSCNLFKLQTEKKQMEQEKYYRPLMVSEWLGWGRVG